MREIVLRRGEGKRVREIRSLFEERRMPQAQKMIEERKKEMERKNSIQNERAKEAEKKFTPSIHGKSRTVRFAR